MINKIKLKGDEANLNIHFLKNKFKCENYLKEIKY